MRKVEVVVYDGPKPYATQVLESDAIYRALVQQVNRAAAERIAAEILYGGPLVSAHAWPAALDIMKNTT